MKREQEIRERLSKKFYYGTEGGKDDVRFLLTELDRTRDNEQKLRDELVLRGDQLVAMVNKHSRTRKVARERLNTVKLLAAAHDMSSVDVRATMKNIYKEADRALEELEGEQ